MSKHITWLMLVAMPWAGLLGQACCNAGGLASCGNTGPLTGLRSNSAGVKWMRVPFETTDQAEDGPYQDDFYVAEIAVRYQVTPRWKLQVQQPYRWNLRRLGQENDFLHGLADTRLTASYALLDNRSMGSNSMLYWDLGAGVKLPTGKYDQRIYFRDLPGNLNLGMGNFALLLQSNLVLFHQKYGLAFNGGYQLNGESRDGYQYGDQLAGGLSFREWGLSKNWILVPMAGVLGEHFGKNYQPSGNFAEGSGGGGCLANLGLQARSGKFQFGCSAAYPFLQNYSDGAIAGKLRFTVDLNYFF